MGQAGTTAPIVTRQVDRLAVRVYADRASMGSAAAADVAAAMRAALAKRGGVRMAFAAAPSQEEFLAALGTTPGLDWLRVTAFQLDDYVGLAADAPERFAHFLRTRLFDQVQPGQVHAIGAAADAAAAVAECERYATLLAAAPLDVVCLGIGENGHLAFNDPPVADFQDPERVKLVELDDACRRQQVNDGCFPSLAAVPTHAITLTIPTLLSGARLSAVVPGPTKRAAVRRTLSGPIETACPASILRTHPACTLYLDPGSYDG
jgi:glucosamine-6-phosphate deaminase